MLAAKFHTPELTNGMTILGQHMPQASSAALTILVPAGSSHCPVELDCAAAIGCEWFMRGAAGKDTRQLNDHLDRLGCQHHEVAQGEHIVFAAAQLGRNLHEVLAIWADILCRPNFGDETFDSCRSLVEQDLVSLEDAPAKRCVLLLKEKFYPYPLGRCVYGSKESLASANAGDIRLQMAKDLTANGTILAVAGNIEWPSFLEQAEKLFGQWPSKDHEAPSTSPSHGGVTHITKDSAQTHIGLAHASATADSEHYYAARMAEMVLSGGMASRLFTEVREKRGLAYHVSSRYNSLKSCAGMITYAGTTPQKAQETLEVTVRELKGLTNALSDDEMARARTQLKSALVMQGESTEARSGALASDWYHLRRLRSLRELADAVDRVSIGDVKEYLAAYPVKNLTIMTIGPQPLDTSGITG